ncbi:ferritin heavy chain-like [Carcharodon carcharias]|uniref:ferritin heavy chain-like n=1 Tax=Carcharodon carcharias TaxID=13397 RepID=UPI001B7EC159|nr:ferritin heavy chain-like [Carcharodon carcharias]
MKQVNPELYSSYVPMSFYFDQDGVALHHPAELSYEEWEHAEKLMKFHNKHRGRISLEDIKKPELGEWSNELEAMQGALQLEKALNHSLQDLHKLSSWNTDPHLCDFLETHYLNEQMKMIKKPGDHMLKKDEGDKSSNYRAVSLILLLENLLETIIQQLEKNGLINKSQHRSVKSSLTK